MLYTDFEDNEFFCNNQFNFEALEKITCVEFAKAIKEKFDFYLIGISRFTYKKMDNCLFLDFYGVDHYRVKFLLLHAYFDSSDYFSIESVDYKSFRDLGLKLIEE